MIRASNTKSIEVFLSSASTETALVGTKGEKINSIATNINGVNNFPENTWGLCFNNGEGGFCSSSSIFNPIASSTSPVKIISKDLGNTLNRFSTSEVTYRNNDGTLAASYAIDRDFNQNFRYAGKINRDLLSDTYTQTLLISAIAEDRPTILTDLEYMQDITPKICTDTPTPSNTETYSVFTKQLIDKRDNKKYWVAKLADGHCWMTQNLALDLSTSKTLTPADTDISANWTPSSDTTSNAQTGNTSNTSIQSWNFGGYIVGSPNAGTDLCSSYVANLQSCSGFSSLTNVGSGTGYTDDFVSTGTDANIVAIDTVNKKYDAHYLLGNYYTWNAATAGTGGTIINSNAASSICPKGWHLPTSNNTDPGSFAHLLNTTYGKITGRQIGQAPLYFAYSGLIDPLSAGGLYLVGDLGVYWSSTAYSTTFSAYYLIFGSGYLGSSDYGTRGYDGFSARCMI